MATEKTQIIDFLNEHITHTEFRVKARVFDEQNNKQPQRDVFFKIQSYLKNFLNGEKNPRWIILTGLRGVGKTTVLSQIFYDTDDKDVYKLFLSVDQTSQILGVSLNEVISSYEDLISRSLETLDKPLLLFLDEVQYDPKWGVVLKSIFDRSNKVFIFATGSASLLLKSNTDIARRALFERLFPLSFTEYLKIKNQKPEPNALSERIQEILFSSANAKEIYNKLSALEQEINKYYLGISRHEFDKYLHYGSMPFAVSSSNESIIYDQINQTLDRVINHDIVSTQKFSTEIISKIPRILYAVADMDAFNVSVIASSFEISRPIVMEIFELLEQTEVLHRIYAHGSHLNQAARKPSKYLFSSPAFRAMYYKMTGSSMPEEAAKGKLHEDLVGMYLHRIFHKNPGKSLTYDSARGGADFILGTGKRRIVIEVGAGKKDYGQIIATSEKVKPDYGFIISNNNLEYSQELNALKVPLRLFLLI